ncbi:MAG TPA: DUF998 domain-containing protein [Opitutus sp.]|nr:DUF998 domain-containing protein [Opitutus sp.]
MPPSRVLTTESSGDPSRIGPTFSLAALVLAVVAMTALHVLGRTLDPIRAPISFYVHGAYGWLLPFALAAFGAAAVSLSLPGNRLRLSTRSRAALALFGAGMILTAIIPSDRWFPWEATPTWSGLVHAGAAIVAPLLLLAPMIGLARRSTRRPRAARLLLVTYVGGLLSSGVSLLAGLLLDSSPPLIGLGERLLALGAVAWLALCARDARWVKTPA